MAQASSIEWTHSTWNPVVGCTKVSAGCKHCYAERMAKRLAAMARSALARGGQPGRTANYLTVIDDRGHWSGALFLDDAALEDPLAWKAPRAVFVNSMSDLFQENVPLPFIQRVFGVMSRCPQHTFQILTKRPHLAARYSGQLRWAPNIWMGTSVENAALVHRVRELRQTDAHVKFLSVEPLLGPIPRLPLTGIHWVIVGGESGPGARPAQPKWARHIRDRCIAHGVPFFFKQWGGVNKRRTGRLLDGRTWDETPNGGAITREGCQLPHKADESFFNRKRSWSRKKDQILAYYLEPYLAKVARLQRPILIVDGFAGPGKFGDGEFGSPLIICAKAKAAIAKGAAVKVICIEAAEALHCQLQGNLSGFPFAYAAKGTFVDHLPRIRELARTHTVFLYVDPCTVEGIEWTALDDVFQIQESGASVELLLNFNGASFVRRGLALLQKHVPTADATTEDPDDPEESDAPMAEPVSADRLSLIVGGEWWKTVLADGSSFPEQVKRVTEEVCRKLRQRFKEVGFTAIKGRLEHPVPKYYLIFASRHPDGLELMNDAMAKARGTSMFYLDLFSHDDLKALILRLATSSIERGELIRQVMREAFCMFSRTEIRGCIQDLLNAVVLKSSTGKTRINDEVKVVRAEGFSDEPPSADRG